MPHKPPLTPLSAALTLVQWREQHGTWPRAAECVRANGLPHWTTLYRLFPNYPTAIDTASSVALLWQEGAQAVASALAATVSLTRPQPTYKPCMRCSALIVWVREKPIRHCGACREWLMRGHEEEAVESEIADVLARWEALG